MSEESFPRQTESSVRQIAVGEAVAHSGQLDWVAAIPGPLAIAKAMAPFAAFAAVLFSPTPEGLTPEGQRALAVMVLALILWTTQAAPIAVVGLVSIVLLVAIGAVPDIGEAINGFSTPVPYFMVAALTMGLAMQNTGLAQRIAFYLIRLAGRSSRMLYVQMVLTFSALSFLLPNASTRIAVMLPIYEDVMARWKVPSDASLNKCMMMALGLLNIMASTAILAGGQIPLVAASLLGNFKWTQWFILMSVPMYANLILGAVIIYVYYRSGFRGNRAVEIAAPGSRPVQKAEIRAALILLGTGVLWMTDFAHGMHPAIPALMALCIILLPRVELLSWREFESSTIWSIFFTIGASLSLAHALASSGATAWLAQGLAVVLGGLGESPLLLLLAVAIASIVMRPMVSNVTAYVAFIVPVGMAIGQSVGLNPLVAGMTTVVVGSQHTFYPAQQNGTMLLLERTNLSSVDLLRLALILGLAATLLLFLIAVPYWALLGEGLTG